MEEIGAEKPYPSLSVWQDIGSLAGETAVLSVLSFCAAAAISSDPTMLYRQIIISLAQLAHNLLNIHLSVLLMPIVQLVK
jgi:H2-forming N5,N10-methylenetetrahydromethanopterin dehydrogenase-like enzyme